MEAKVEKKATQGKFKSWKIRCWRIRDRRLIHYNSSCTEWSDCISSKVKLDIDLAHMASASFYPKANPKPNYLHIKHPKIGNNKDKNKYDNITAVGGLLLRFNSNQKPGQDIMCSWLKVLTAWGVNRKQNRIYVAIPSNFSYAFWNILNALYDHPDLLTTQGIFRQESTVVRVKHELCNNLLYELITLQDLKTKYNDIDLLAKSLQYLLSNLPCSIFGDHNFEDLLDEIKTYNITLIDNQTAKTMSDTDLDNDVASLSYEYLVQLKTVLHDMYLGEMSHKYKHRYGIISLILHLCKQVSMNHAMNRMSCHVLSRLFSMCFESKQYIQNMLDPFRSLLLIKVLIFHAYFLFPVEKWRMKDIVVAEKQEAITMEKYKELKLTKKEKKNRLKKMIKEPATRHFNANLRINNMSLSIPFMPVNDEEEKEEKKEEISQFVKKQQEKLRNLGRYQSHDDLDIGSYERKQQHDILSLNKKESIHHFETIHRKVSVPSGGLSRHYKSVDIFDGDDDDDDDDVPMYKRERSISMGYIPTIKTPSMSTLSGFARINQNKILTFTQPCYLNNGIYGEWIYFIGKNTGQCHKYNIKSNQYMTFVNYQDKVDELDNFTACMDENGKRLFILSGKCEFMEWMNIDDEKEYIWNDKNVKIYVDGVDNVSRQTHYNLRAYGDDVNSIFIASEICELHVIGGKLNNYHMRWDEHYHKMIKLHEFNNFDSIQGHGIVYINNEWNKAFKSKLCLLGGYIAHNDSYTNQILHCDMKENMKQSSWNTLDNITLPTTLAYFGAVVYHNIFIIIFGGKSGKHFCDEIWYLNINSMLWKCSKIKCPLKWRGRWYAILTHDNVIHLFQRDYGKHFSIKMNEIISDKELNLAEKEQENKYKHQHHQQHTTLEISRQKEIFYKTASTSIDMYTDTSMTPIPKDYEIKEIKQKKEKKIKERVRSDEEDYDETSPLIQNEEKRDVEVETERFSCKALYKWFVGFCGTTETEPPGYNRAVSNSYDID